MKKKRIVQRFVYIFLLSNNFYLHCADLQYFIRVLIVNIYNVVHCAFSVPIIICVKHC